MAKKTNALLSGNLLMNQAKLGAAIDYSAMLDESVKILKDRFDLANTTTASFLNNMPEDFSAEIVPVEGRELLTKFLRQNKDRYVELSKIAGQYSSRPTSEEYINATNELEKIKSSFLSTKTSLENFAAMREDAANNINNWSPAMTGIDQNTYKEIIGKEAYKNLEYTNDGIFYTDASGKRTNINDLSGAVLRDNEAANGLYTALDASAKAGAQGVEFTFDENGNPADLNSRMILRSVQNILSDPSAAADLFIGGVPGYETDISSNPAYQYISEQIALGNSMFTDIPVDANGNIDFTSDEYLMKLEELKSNVPTDWLNSFVMDLMKDANLESFGKYNESKSSGGKGGFEGGTNFGSFFEDLAGGSMMKIPGLGQKVQYAKYNNDTQKVEIYNSDRAMIAEVGFSEFMGEIGVPRDLRQKVLDYFSGGPMMQESRIPSQMRESTLELFEDDVSDNDEEDIRDGLRTLYPDLDIKSPVNPFSEKIVIEGKEFYIREDDFDPQQIINWIEEVKYGKKSSSKKVSDALNVDNTEANTETNTEVNAETTTPNTQENTGTLLSQKLNNQQQQIVKTISIDGTTGANRADILVNGQKIQTKVYGGAATVIGVRAEGGKIVADAKPIIGGKQSKNIGEFKLNSDGTASFVPNQEIYKELKGEEKMLFDTMVLAMKTDPEYVKQVLGAVEGNTRFDSKNY